MSIARAALRMQRLEPTDNSFARFPDEVLGHELDWLAMRIGRDVIERDIKEPGENAIDDINKHPSSSSSSSQSQYKPPSIGPSSNVQCRHLWRLHGAIDTNHNSVQFSPPSDRHNTAAILLAYRTRLASLTDSSTLSATPTRDFKTEMVEVRTESRRLGDLIEATFKAVLSKAKIKEQCITKLNGSQSIFWGISCSLSDADSLALKKHVVYIELVREDQGVKGSPWIIKDKRVLEGILGLWVWSLKSDPAIEVKDPNTGLIKSLAGDVQARRVVATDQMNEPDLEIWLGEDINNITKYDLDSLTEYGIKKPYLPFDSNNPHDASSVWRKAENAGGRSSNQMSPNAKSREQLFRLFGWSAAGMSQDRYYPAPCLYSAPVKGSLVSACAQEVFVSFLTSIFDMVEDFGPVNVQEGETFRLENSLLTEALGLFTEMRLGSRQEALVCLVPLMIPRLKVSSAEGALVAAKEAATHHRRGEDWEKAEKLLRWAWNICTHSEISCTAKRQGLQYHHPVSVDELGRQATIALCELYRWALVEGNQRAFGTYGISWLNEQRSSQSLSTCETIDHYVFVADNIAHHQSSDSDLTAVEEVSLGAALLFVTRPASQIENIHKGNALCLAAKRGWNEVVFALLELRIEPDFQDTEGRTALSYAAESGNVELVRECLSWGSFPDLRDSKQRTPLSHAAEAGAGLVTELLLKDIRVSPDQRDWRERTPLHWAAMNVHSTVVEQLWETAHVVSLETKDQDGCTPLSLAARNGYVSTVEWLLARADPETKDNSGRTPLSWAAEIGHTSTVERLLAKADTDAKDPSGRTPLSWAAANGHVSTVECLLTKSDQDMKDNSGNTPLAWAAKLGHTSIVKCLLSSKADFNARTNRGDTPLLLAADNGHEPIVEALLAESSDPNTKNDSGETPLLRAVQNGHESIVKCLLASNAQSEMDSDKRTPLSWAAEKGYKNVVKHLLASKADPNRKDTTWNQTPLFWASSSGHASIVECLLASKADPNITGKNGRAPLSVAAEEGHPVVAECLLASNADSSIRDHYGRTPLSLAAKEGHPAVVECLLASNADPSTRDDYGRTPLFWAALEGRTSVVEYLIAIDIDPNTKDDLGRTPLLGAAKEGHYEVVRCLLANGADPNISDNSGDTPLCLAAEDGSLPVVKPLVENNAKINTCNGSGDTPLLLAAKGMWDYLVKYLLDNNADFNISNESGETPLFWAKHWKDDSSVKQIEKATKEKILSGGG